MKDPNRTFNNTNLPPKDDLDSFSYNKHWTKQKDKNFFKQLEKDTKAMTPVYCYNCEYKYVKHLPNGHSLHKCSCVELKVYGKGNYLVPEVRDPLCEEKNRDNNCKHHKEKAPRKGLMAFLFGEY